MINHWPLYGWLKGLHSTSTIYWSIGTRFKTVSFITDADNAIFMLTLRQCGWPDFHYMNSVHCTVLTGNHCCILTCFSGSNSLSFGYSSLSPTHVYIGYDVRYASLHNGCQLCSQSDDIRCGSSCSNMLCKFSFDTGIRLFAIVFAFPDIQGQKIKAWQLMLTEYVTTCINLGAKLHCGNGVGVPHCVTLHVDAPSCVTIPNTMHKALMFLPL